MPMDRNAALDRLVRLYTSGLLAPFLGAGMSRPGCRDWVGFVRTLVEAAGDSPPWLDTQRPPERELVQIADSAVRKLKYRGASEFAAGVRQALGKASETPPQTAALARIHWPLVLTTNYDDLYASQVAGTADFSSVAVVGRSAADCERVLGSLRSPSTPLLWALQGYLGGQHPAARSSERPDLERELVIGHEEYRRVTFTEPWFRQAFGEAFRSRSLLFLGSGLADPYLLELFGQVLELAGANPIPHFAMAREGELDVDFLERRLNIFPIVYAEHAELPELLDELRERIHAPRPRASRWVWSMRAGNKIGPEAEGELEVVRAKLAPPGERGCLALSAGLGVRGRLVLSQPIDALARKVAGPRWRGAAPGLDPGLGIGVVRLPKQPVFLCVARAQGGSDRRHLRAIGEATRVLLDEVSSAPDGFERIHMQLLAVGQSREFPAHLSFVETVRAAAAWFREHPDANLRLTLHVIAPDVLHALTSGKLDVAELLGCADLRLWIEVVAQFGPRLRQQVFVPPTLAVFELVARFVDQREAWQFEVVPAPTRSLAPQPLAELAADDTVASLGVAPGMTIRLSQIGRASG